MDDETPTQDLGSKGFGDFSKKGTLSGFRV